AVLIADGFRENQPEVRHRDDAVEIRQKICRVGTEPSAVAPGQLQSTNQKTTCDPALPRSVLCLLGKSLAYSNWSPHLNLRSATICENISSPDPLTKGPQWNAAQLPGIAPT